MWSKSLLSFMWFLPRYPITKLHQISHGTRYFWQHGCRYRFTCTLVIKFPLFVATSVATTRRVLRWLSVSSVCQSLTFMITKVRPYLPTAGESWCNQVSTSKFRYLIGLQAVSMGCWKAVCDLQAVAHSCPGASLFFWGKVFVSKPRLMFLQSSLLLGDVGCRQEGMS